MACNICQDDYGLTLCNCSFTMCKVCAIKHIESKNKDECPQCKQSMKTKHFFSGKICDKDDLSNLSLNRVFVHKDDDTDPGILCTKHGLGRGQNKPHSTQLVALSDFMRLDIKLKPADLDPLNQSLGPFIIIDLDTTSGHGQIEWNGGGYGGGYGDDEQVSEGGDSEDEYRFEGVHHPFANIVDISDTVINRNTEAIKACDTFTLKVNNDNDCFYSYVEWGQAQQLQKILILDIDPKNVKLKEYYLFAKQSIISLEKMTFTKKESIIQIHPEIQFENYKSYEKFMYHIINLKKG